MNYAMRFALALTFLFSSGHFAPKQSANGGSEPQIVIDNQYVRVYRADFKPGETSSYTVPDGVSAALIRLRIPKPGDKETALQLDRVQFLADGELMTHADPDKWLREVRIELKSAPPATPFEKDAVKLDPGHNILLDENNQFRVVQVHFGPGEQGPAVDKRPRVIIVLVNTKAQVVKPGGSPEERDSTAGQIQWSLGGSQSTINGHQGRLENTVVEIK
jgi:hypothetical protein